MITSRLVYSLFLPLVIWLLYGAPDLARAGNAVVLAVVVLHLYAVIWTRPIFSLFEGDAFTYGAVALGINICSFVSTFTTGFITFFIYDHSIASPSQISPIAWGFIGVGFLVTIAVPILSTRHVNPLPKASSRREFENPSSTQE